MSTLDTTTAVVADLWSRAIERTEGEPRVDAPSPYSSQAVWDRVIARVDAAVATTGRQAPPRAAVPAALIGAAPIEGRWWE